MQQIETQMVAYLDSLGIAPAIVVRHLDVALGTLTYTLNTPPTDTDTLGFKDRPELGLEEELVSIVEKGGAARQVRTVSRKEIVLALLQHGRLTRFKGPNCAVEVLKDHVGVRQNTVAWAEEMELVWPDGDAAEWNPRYWTRGTPKPEVPLHAALDDVFQQQDKYAIGCYTAAKIVMLQGVLDYYRRVKRDAAMYKRLEARLLIDQEPLVGIEPEAMWRFEPDFDAEGPLWPGKLMRIVHGVPARHFIPGDWAYLLNTDPVTYLKTGYEGSNAIYMGRNRFVDLYNDSGHYYTFEEKANEVYQWRNGVFNRIRDAAKARPLSAQELEGLRRTPAEGGLLMDFRVSPYLLGPAPFPALP